MSRSAEHGSDRSPATNPADLPLTILLWSIVAALIGRLQADPDLWGHLRFGLDLLRDRTLPAVDPYSFTQDRPWVNHEWLSELQMAVAYRLGGDAGLLALKWLVFGTACVLVARALRPVPFLPRALAVFVFMWACAPQASAMRPQLWSLAAATAITVLLAARSPGPRLLWIPLIVALWVNVHGGWLVGGLLLGPWCVFKVGRPQWRRWVLVVAALTLLATLCNPYGWRLWQFLAETVRVGRDIQEWRPLTAAPLVDWWPWLLTTLFVLAAALSRQMPRHGVLTTLLLAFFSFRVVRLVPFFVIAALVYGIPALQALAARRRWLRWAPTAPSSAAAALLYLPTIAVAAFAVWQDPSTCIPVRGIWVPDVTTARALQAARPTGRLLTEFGWGEYAIWHFGPALTVSMDGRRETVYTDATLQAHDAQVSGDPTALQRLAADAPEYVWLMHTRAASRTWLAAHGYRIDVEGERGWLAVRQDLPKLDAPPAAATARRCFPE